MSSTQPLEYVHSATDLQRMMEQKGVVAHIAEKTAHRIIALSRATPLAVSAIEAHVNAFLNAYLDENLPPGMGRMMASMVFTLPNITAVYDAIAAWTGKLRAL